MKMTSIVPSHDVCDLHVKTTSFSFYHEEDLDNVVMSMVRRDDDDDVCALAGRQNGLDSYYRDTVCDLVLKTTSCS